MRTRPTTQDEPPTSGQSGPDDGRVGRVRARLESAFGAGTLNLLLALLGAGLLNIGFHSLVVRALDPAALQDLGVLLLILFACSVSFDAVLVFAVRETVLLRASSPGQEVDWRPASRRVTTLAGLLGVALGATVAAGPSNLTGAQALTPLVVAGYLIALGAGLVPRAVLLGRCEYRSVGTAMITGVGVRCAVFVVASGVGAGFGGAVAALAVGELVSSAMVSSRAGLGSTDRTLRLELDTGPVVRAALALAGIWALLAVQAGVAHSYLPRQTDTRYFSGLDVARMVLFFPQAIVTVALARFSHGGRAGGEALRIAVRASCVTAMLAAVVVVALGPASLAPMLSTRPDLPFELLVMIAVTGCALGVLMVLVAYHLACGLPCAGTTWAAVAATFLGTLLWHADVVALAMVSVLAVLAALARLLAGPALVGVAAERPGRERRRVGDCVDAVDLSVVVPFFNPGGEILHRHLVRLLKTLEGERVRFEVLAVSDGSTDGSERLARELGPRGVRTVVLASNGGKGAALRAGLVEARGKYLGFIDADGDIPAELWRQFLTLMRRYDADMVVGSKRHPSSQVHYPPLRRLYSRAFQALVHALFRVDVTDTQTGIKLFRRDVLVDVLPLLVERGYVFDLELLAIARRRGWRRVLEAPVRVEHRFRSTISIRSVASMLRDTLALAGRLHVTRYYDLPTRAALQVAPDSLRP